ncbi:MAG: hypothetical protein GY796_07120 [Chloroflexi bacterium]|nr:hypothetical protein [Chloroflexota bacterium]
MSTTQQFAGLSMPVFTAFGWAGQEAAVNYALEQLEVFILSLQASLPRSVQAEFGYAGLSRQSQTVYLAANEDVESDIQVVFIARPTSLEMQLVLTDKKMLTKSLKLAEAKPMIAHRLITELGSDYSFRVQQMQVDEETDTASHYQDLFKDGVVKLDEETAVAVISKAAYLNSEEQWVTPLYVSRRFEAEKISVMRRVALDVIGQEIQNLMPLIQFLTGHKVSKKKKAKSKKRAKVKSIPSSKEVAVPEIIAPEDGFIYLSEIKPLHLSRGFVNMTPDHWPFFSINSRTVIRPVTVYYDGIYDKESSVWRLRPSDIARLVLSPRVHQWLEDNFENGDYIQLLVKNLEDKEIQISLKPIEM